MAAHAHVVKRETLLETRWLRSVKLTYADERGKQRVGAVPPFLRVRVSIPPPLHARKTASPRPAHRTSFSRPLSPPHQLWEMVERTTRLPGSSCDAVAVLCVLQPPDSGPELLLVRQFRPPVDAHTIELPAGLIDAGETAQRAALRELKEETGYVGEVLSVSPPLPLSPGLSNESIALVHVRVDLSLPENRSPVAHNEESECIQVLRLPLASLRARLEERAAAGDRIFCGNHALLIGLEMGGALERQRPLRGWEAAACSWTAVSTAVLLLLGVGAVFGAALARSER